MPRKVPRFLGTVFQVRGRFVLGVVVAATMVLGSCGEPDTVVEPGPAESEVQTSVATTEPPSEVETVETTSSELAPSTTTGSSAVPQTTTSFVVAEGSPNAEAYVELARSELVLSVDEQICTDAEATERIEAGSERLDALVSAIQRCASPEAVDTFAAGLLSAGGAPLPATEAACVGGRLRSEERYQPFWAELLSDADFDYLASPVAVQDLYVDLFAECVSVGRALAGQLDGMLSNPSIGCIDALYEDAEFVRVTIEADLSGNAEDISRIDSQIQSCLSAEELEALGLS